MNFLKYETCDSSDCLEPAIAEITFENVLEEEDSVVVCENHFPIHNELNTTQINRWNF
jgi:hypothetical protein